MTIVTSTQVWQCYLCAFVKFLNMHAAILAMLHSSSPRLYLWLEQLHTCPNGPQTETWRTAVLDPSSSILRAAPVVPAPGLLHRLVLRGRDFPTSIRLEQSLLCAFVPPILPAGTVSPRMYQFGRFGTRAGYDLLEAIGLTAGGSKAQHGSRTKGSTLGDRATRYSLGCRMVHLVF